MFLLPFRALRQSLTFKTLANMIVRLMLVILLISGISYWHLMRQLASDTQAQLLSYITERGQREESIFTLAEDNHVLLHDEFLGQFTAQSGNSLGSLGRFQDHFFPWSDGTVRNVTEGTESNTFDTVHEPTVFVQSGVALTTDIQQRLQLSYELVKLYGSGWRDRFLDTYISLPEGAMIVLWPGAAWGINADPQLNIKAEEWAYLGDKTHNPQRQILWTGVYADPVTKDWMVSGETPIDDADGRHLGTIGHDIVLTRLIERVIDDHLDGTYNLLVRSDGQLIAEPHLMAKIRAAAGKLNVQTAGEPHLARLFTLAQQTSEKYRVIYNAADREYLAIARLASTNWDLITVYPETLLRAKALDATWFLIGLGLMSLGLETLLLFTVLQNNIATPLKSLLGATEQLTDGDFKVSLDTDRPDEWGQLATAFTQMAQQLQAAFTDLEQKVVEQEQAQTIILEKTQALEQAFQELQQMQLQTVQSEKMSALGNLVAGVAHEINNPVGFLQGNIKPAQEYIQDLLGLIELYQEKIPTPDADIEGEIEAIDLEFIREDLPKLLGSMDLGVKRIRKISDSLRTFSRQDQEYKTAFDIHEGIDSTLLILKHRTKTNEQRPEIKVVKNYGDLFPIDCFPGQLNQVFMNILANAIDAFDEANLGKDYGEIEANLNTITIQTLVIDEQVQIQIQDNGCGIKPEMVERIFEQGFTTKEVGKGTGLGMAIARQIVVEKHGGSLDVQSDLGQGTNFCIYLPIHAEL